MILLPIIWLTVFFGGWGLLFLIVHWIGKALHQTSWSVATKQTIYAASAALLVAPMFPLPVPSVALIVAFALTPTAPVALKFWTILPSVAVTFIVGWLIARGKFLERSDSDEVADSVEET